MTCGADWWDEQTPDPPDDEAPPPPDDPVYLRFGQPVQHLPDIANYQPTT